MITASVDMREFNKAMDELRKATGMEDGKIIFNTTKGLMINLVRFTFLFKRVKGKPGRDSDGRFVKNARTQELQRFIESKAKGRARLGWWPAWKALGVRGTPHIGNGPLKDRGEGGIIDRSRKIINPHITVFNEVPYIDASEEKKRTVKRAVDRQLGFIMKAIDKSYTRILKGKSG